jgi:hypothetical protein
MFAQVSLPSSSSLPTFSLAVYPITNPNATSLSLSGFRLTLIEASTSRVLVISLKEDSGQLNFTSISEVRVLGPTIAYAGQIITLTVVPAVRP